MGSGSAAGRRRRHRKVLGSLAVVSAAAAVAGLGTFGTFTDSTSTTTGVQSGVVSLDLGTPGGLQSLAVTTSGFVAGDSFTRRLNLENDGDSALSSVTLAATASPSNLLTTDPVNGLQLTLRTCSQTWTEGGTRQLPSYTCGGTERTLYSGPAVASQTLSDPLSLTPGGEDQIVFSYWLPQSAGNDKQALGTTLSLGFTGVQRNGAPR